MAEYRINVTVDPSRAKRGAAQVGQALDRTGGRADRLRLLLVRVGGVLSATFGAAAVVRTIASFGTAMSTVRAVTGATTEEFARLRATARKLGSETRFTATQAADGMAFLARAGFDTNEVLASIGGTLALATAGALDLARAADIASNILQGFRLETNETGRVVDVLAFAANNSNTNVEQLGEAMKFVAPVAAGLGVSIEEAAAAVGVLSDNGLQASLAGTGLRRVLSELESPAKKTADILQELGLTTADVRVSQVGLTTALERLTTAGLDTGQALELFGDRGGPAFEVLSSGIPRVIELTSELGNAAGEAQRASDIMDDNLEGAFRRTLSAASDLAIAFGDLGTESIFTRVLDGAANVLRRITAELDGAEAATTGIVENLRDRFGNVRSTVDAFRTFFVGVFNDIRAAARDADFPAVDRLSSLLEFLPDAENLALVAAGVTGLSIAVGLLAAAMRGLLLVSKRLLALGGVAALLEFVSGFAGGPALGISGDVRGAGEDSRSGINAFIEEFRARDREARLQAGLPLEGRPRVGETVYDAPVGPADASRRAGAGSGTLVLDSNASGELAGALRAAWVAANPPGLVEPTGQADEFTTALEQFGRRQSQGLSPDRLQELEQVVVSAQRPPPAYGGPIGPQQQFPLAPVYESPIGPEEVRLTQQQVEALDGLVASLDRVGATEQELTRYQVLLDDAVTAGNLTTAEAVKLNLALTARYREQTDPVGKLQRQLEAEVAQRRIALDVRGREGIVLRQVQRLRADGHIIGETEIEDLRRIASEREHNSDLLQLEEGFYRALQDPVETYRTGLDALNNVLSLHPATADEARFAHENLRLQFLDTQQTFEAGFERGLIRVGQNFRNFGALAEQAVTGWATAAEDVLVNFVRTGKLSFKDLIDSILADLARLAVRKFITGPIADLLGLGSGGIGGDIFSGIGSSIARSIGSTALGEALAGTAVGDFLGIGAAGASAAASLAAAGTVAGTAVAAAGSSTVIGLAGAGVTAAGTLAVAGSTAATGFAGAGAAAAAGISTAGGTIGAGIASAGSSISAGIASAGSSAATAIGSAAAALGPLAIAIAGAGALTSFFGSRRAKKSQNRINTLVSYVDQENLTPQGTQRLSEILSTKDSEEQLRRAIRLPRRPTNYSGRGSPSQAHREAVRRYNARIEELRNNPVTFNTGGYVSGAGTGTSDSIAARISNGEFVVNAAATRSNLPLLEAINDNAPRFQTGGLVESRSEGAARGGTRVIVNDYRSQEAPLASVRQVRRSDGGEDWIVEVRDALRSGELDSAVDDRFGVKPVAA